MTVAELIGKLHELNGRWPVLALHESGGWANAELEVINEDKPRPYVVIRTLSTKDRT